jgi:peptidylprolyl isomerase
MFFSWGSSLMTCRLTNRAPLVWLALLLGCCLPGPGWTQQGPSTDALSKQKAAAAEQSSPVADAADESSPESRLRPAEPALDEMPPEFVKEMKQAEQQFKHLRAKLADKLIEMRTTHTLYLNDEVRTPEALAAYRRQRNESRQLMNETFDAALNVIRYRGDTEAARYLVTMIQHRFQRDIYNATTLEAGARLIDGGVRLAYVFLATGRSAMTVGDFALARKIYESLDPDDLEDVDKTLIARADVIETEWQKEKQLFDKEAQADRLPRVKLVTTRGEILVELFIDQAPSTVANFIKLVDAGYYDGLDFYQVVDHLLALTGDENGDGSGSTGKYLQDEHQREDARAAVRGSLVMAKIPLEKVGEFVPNSGSAQFAILYLPITSIAEQQTVFGRVIEGMDVVGSLRRVDPNKKKGKGEIVMPPDRVLSATVVRRPEKLPEIVYAQPGSPSQPFAPAYP